MARPTSSQARPSSTGSREPRTEVVDSETAESRVPRNSVGIVVVGETPYAEGFGDVGGPLWAYDPGDNGVPRPEKTMRLSDADTKAVRVLRPDLPPARSSWSGRPMCCPQGCCTRRTRWSRCRGCRAVREPAWRTSSTGTCRRPAGCRRGWPRTVGQEPINVGDRDATPSSLRVGAARPLVLSARGGRGPWPRPRRRPARSRRGGCGCWPRAGGRCAR